MTITRMLTAATGAALMMMATPVAAQEAKNAPRSEQAEMEAGMAELAALFTATPLTTEERARLPQAEKVIGKMMPPGTMGEIMEGMLKGILGPIMTLAEEPGSTDVAELLGREDAGIELSDADAAAAMAILDPAWSQRRKAEMAAMQAVMPTIMGAIEPAMRTAMAEAYAVTFSASELTDIDAFFATPSGASFARKSYKLSSDPRLIGGMMQAMPQMMGEFGKIEAQIKAATAGIPAARSHGALSAAERARLAALTGLSQREIAEGMTAAASEESGED